MNPRSSAAPAAAEPSAQRYLVERPGLANRLLAGSAAAVVTLVAAPAGWGKTQLAAQWGGTGAVGRRQAWVGLGVEHDAVDAFWSAVVRALTPVVGPSARAALGRLLDGVTAAHEMPAAVVAALERTSHPVVVVLDDLHLVTAPEVHQGLVWLAERSPPALSLLVLTRRDPPWPLARMRLAGSVAEVGTDDLAFGSDEAAELFARLGVQLDPMWIDVLVERTEGWPAGLCLAALHLRGRRDPEAVAAAFSGDHHAVAEYLDSEVLAALPAEQARFLRTISVVDPVCADLADALTGRRDGERLLGDLAGAHLVLPAVDRSGRWYHLRRLIADVVRSRPGSRRNHRDLQRRAAEWFRDADRPLDALRSAVAGGIWPLACDLSGRYLLSILHGGHGRELEEALARLSRPVLAVHPELACAVAGARVIRGSRAEVAELLDEARAALEELPEARAARCRVLLALFDAALARLRGDWAAVSRLAGAAAGDPLALSRLGIAEAEIVPAMVDNLLGMAALLDGGCASAERHLHAALSTVLAPPSLSQLNAAGYLALLRGERGELPEAEEAALGVVSRADAIGLRRSPQVLGAYLAMARVALDRLDFDEVDDWLMRAGEALVDAPEPHVQVHVALLRAARRAAVGRHEQALLGLRAGAGAARLAKLPRRLRLRWLMAEAGLLVALGDPASARALLTGTTLSASVGAARLLLEFGDLDAATAARSMIEPRDDPRGRTELELLDVALAATAGDERTALDRLETALVEAAPFSLRRPFHTVPVDIRALLERRLESGTVVPIFALDLLEGVAVVTGTGPARGLADPLTEREHTVLRYLASTLSNAEIASELFVSVNTVKTHERAVYRKLGVANRREAVIRARALGLL